MSEDIKESRVGNGSELQADRLLCFREEILRIEARRWLRVELICETVYRKCGCI